MKKNNKKGFTIVELVIVIAVIAILAAVLIPTFSSIIKKAKVNNDIQLVRNLNTALATDTKEHKTMQSALDAAAEFGYDIDKINASATDNEILWDSVNDCFVYKTESGKEYIPNSKKTDEEVKDYQFWQIADELPARQTYSIYAGTGWTTATVDNLKVGFDAGTTTGILAINYTNPGSAQDVVIRTNGGTLTVDAEKDSVDFYGAADTVTVDKIAPSSFHVYGTVVVKLEVKNGHVVLENNSIVSKLVSEEVVTVDAKADAILIDNTGVKNETAKANTANATKNAENKSYLNVSNADELMIALGYEKAGEKNYFTKENVEYNGLIRLKANAQIDISDIKINNNDLNCDNGVIVIVNSSIDLNGGTIKTANMNFYIRKDNAVIYNGTFQAGENSNKATGINSYALGIEADNVTLKNLTINGGVSVGFELSASKAVIENCTVKSGDWYAVCAQTGSSVTIKGGTYSRTALVASGNYSSTAIFQVFGTVGDFGSLGDVNRIDFDNVKSEVANPFVSGVTTATIDNNVCSGYVSAKIGG